MRHFHFTDRGNAVNEDFACSTPRYGIVIDGATGLAGAPLFAGRFGSNAQWFSHVVGEAVCEALDAGHPAEKALARAVDAARAELEGALGCSLARADPDAVPSATLALAVVSGEAVELYGLGDSPLVAVLRDGSTLFSTDEVLEGLDAEALRVSRERAAACGRALSGPEKRALVDDVILDHRRMRNAEGGYWCLDPSGAGLAHLRRATLPRSEVVAVAGMSDGMWRAFGLFGLADAASELSALSAGRAAEFVAELRALEARDPDYVRYPRLKRSDDASVFWLGGEE